MKKLSILKYSVHYTLFCHWVKPSYYFPFKRFLLWLKVFAIVPLLCTTNISFLDHNAWEHALCMYYLYILTCIVFFAILLVLIMQVRSSMKLIFSFENSYHFSNLPVPCIVAFICVYAGTKAFNQNLKTKIWLSLKTSKLG